MYSPLGNFPALVRKLLLVGSICTLCALSAWAESALSSLSDSQTSVSPEEESETIPRWIMQFGDEIVVSAVSREVEAFQTPVAITIVTMETLERENQLSIVDTLDDRIGVWVEKRTSSTSDPVIRGLSGGNLLALIDNNTLSTFWGEGGYAGDDMYGKIDPESIERIEVIRGPQSVLYGSNALGGVLNFITKSSPFAFSKEGFHWGMTSKPTYGSAADEIRFRQEFYGATPHFRFLLGGSWRDVGNTHRGGGDILIPTSAEEHNWDFKAQWQPQRKHHFTISLQDVKREKVHRFYRPTQDNFNDREALSIKYQSINPFTGIESLQVDLYYQDKEDLRRFLDQNTFGVARTRTFTANLRLESSKVSRHQVTYGLQYHVDLGESAGDEQFTLFTSDGTKRKASPDTTWQGLGMYIQDEWSASGKNTIIAGVRGDWFVFDADPDEYYHPPGGLDPAKDDLHEEKFSLVGGIGVVHHYSEHLNIVGNYSRGFRLWAPHFGVTQHGYGVVVPSGLLDPVTSDNFDFGIKIKADLFSVTLITYYSIFNNWQIIIPGSFQGSNWFDFNQDSIYTEGEDVYTIKSSGEAYVYGLECEADYALGAVSNRFRGVSLGFGFAWNYGEDETSGEPFRHTQPAEGRFFVLWEREDLKIKPWIRFGAAFIGRFDRIPSDRLLNDVGYRINPQDITSPLIRPYGLPGYSVFDLRAGCRLGEHFSLTLNIENLTDKLYRQAHSRWDEAGLNIVLGLRYQTHQH